MEFALYSGQFLPPIKALSKTAVRFPVASIANPVAIALFLGISATSAIAGGPLGLNPNDPDNLLRWPDGGADIPYNPDQGGLGILGSADANALVATAFQVWQDVPTASATFSFTGVMPFDVDVTNFGPFASNLLFGTNTADGLSPIIFDEDGSIFEVIFGINNSVLAFGGPDTFDANGVPLEGTIFLNGRPLLMGFPFTDYIAVVVHAIGHFCGMGHSAVNAQAIILGDSSGPSPFNTFGDPPYESAATMNHVVPSGAIPNGVTQTLHADDIAFFSTLYPAPGFFSGTGTISGTVWDGDGDTPVSGINVIARNNASPFDDAVSAISGDRGVPGQYTINGLTPGAEYTIQIDEILAGDFNTQPLSPLPAAEEFYNGAGESNGFTSADNPVELTLIEVTAGSPVTGVDIILNNDLIRKNGFESPQTRAPIRVARKR